MLPNDAVQPVPAVDFYGDASEWPLSELVHCEPLAERSALHDWRIRPHRHNDLTQFFLLLDGGGKARLDNEWRALVAPCLFIVPERAVHEFNWEKGSDGFQLSVRSNLSTALAQRIEALGAIFSEAAVIDVSSSIAFVRALFAEIYAEFVEPRQLKDVSIDSLVRLLAIWLARNADDNDAAATLPGRAGYHYARFVKLVDEWHKAHWSAADYADSLGITSSHLNAICQQLVAKSTLDVIHDRLVLAAKRELAYTESNIGGIAHRLGFTDPSYFTRFFKRETGLTPGAYRRRTGTFESGRN